MKRPLKIAIIVVISIIIVVGVFVYVQNRIKNDRFNKVLKIAQEKEANVIKENPRLIGVEKKLDLSEDLVKDLTDQQLLTLVQEYPMIFMVSLQSSSQSAIKRLKEMYTPFRILIERKSGKQLLLNEYVAENRKEASSEKDIGYQALLWFMHINEERQTVGSTNPSGS